MKISTFIALLLTLIAVPLQTFALDSAEEELQPSSNPKKKPVILRGQKALDVFHSQIAPYIKKAKATLPQAKKRFLKGLNPDETLYVTTKVSELGFANTRTNRVERKVFVKVKSWKGTRIIGTIDSQLDMKSRKFGDKIEVDERDVTDWRIADHDGTIEGNFLGKFLDTYTP